jgi:TRAP-type C4-dicarboxylate transport system permease small subunit
MKTIHTMASVLIVLLGCLHIVVTFFNYHGLSYDAVWFLGTGVGIVLAGFMNIAMLRDGGRDTIIWAMALVTNLFFVLGFAAASYMMREPQVFIGASLFLATTIYSSVVKPKAT